MFEIGMFFFCIGTIFIQCSDDNPIAEEEKDTSESNGQLPSNNITDGMTLLFEDQFEGSELDYTKWKRIAAYRVNTVHDVIWRPNNVFVFGGNLIIDIVDSGKLNEKGKTIINAGAITTDGKFNSSHGYYEARIEILKGSPGLSGAFWLMSSKVGNEDNSGRDGAEIDIMEMPWNTGRIAHTIHWDGYGEMHKSDSKTVPPSNSLKAGTWHTFGLKWAPTEYTFYVDGIKTWTSKAGGVSQSKDAYMILSANVLAPWGTDGQPFNVASLPNQMKVDWVKVYGFTGDNLFDDTKIPDADMENESWVLNAAKDAKATLTFATETKFSGEKSMEVNVETAIKNAPYKIRTEKNINLKSNTNYKLTFYAKAKVEGATISSVVVTEANYVENEFTASREKMDVMIGTEWNKYTVEFKTLDISNALDHVTIRFLFPDETTYFLDNISITEL